MKPSQIQQILSMWSISPNAVSAGISGYRNTCYTVTTDQAIYNLIIHKTTADETAPITVADQASQILSRAGLPVRTLADNRLVSIRSANYRATAALHTYLPGHTIPWEAYTMDHLKLAGMTMALMHRAWRGNDVELPDVVIRLNALKDRMVKYFAMPAVKAAAAAKLGVVLPINLEGLIPHVKNGQPLHMDFVRGNILFSDTGGPLARNNLSISGVIDFEKVAFGHPLFDIARSLAFFLVDCKHKSRRQVYKYYLASGYFKRGNIRIAQYYIDCGSKQNFYDALESLTSFFLLHDLYKFMRHNPYESLAQNEHYLRTIAELTYRGIL